MYVFGWNGFVIGRISVGGEVNGRVPQTSARRQNLELNEVPHELLGVGTSCLNTHHLI